MLFLALPELLHNHFQVRVNRLCASQCDGLFLNFCIHILLPLFVFLRSDQLSFTLTQQPPLKPIHATQLVVFIRRFVDRHFNLRRELDAVCPGEYLVVYQVGDDYPLLLSHQETEVVLVFLQGRLVVADQCGHLTDLDEPLVALRIECRESKFLIQ